MSSQHRRNKVGGVLVEESEADVAVLTLIDVSGTSKEIQLIVPVVDVVREITPGYPRMCQTVPFCIGCTEVH